MNNRFDISARSGSERRQIMRRGFEIFRQDFAFEKFGYFSGQKFFPVFAEQFVRRETEYFSRICARLNDAHCRFFKNQNRAVRLNRTGNMNRLAVAVGQINLFV